MNNHILSTISNVDDLFHIDIYILAYNTMFIIHKSIINDKIHIENWFFYEIDRTVFESNANDKVYYE